MSSVKTTESQRPVKPWCPVTVEPLVTMYFIGAMAITPTVQQYVYNTVGNGTLQNASSCDVNVTDPAYQRQLEAQALTSQWLLYMTMASSVPGVLVTLLLGTVSDLFGRKVVLTVPIVGGLLSALITALVINFSLPLGVILAGNALNGMMGDWSALVGGSFAYIADITDPGSQRTFRVALLESAMGISTLVGQIGAGYWILGVGIPKGFQEIAWYVVGGAVFCLLYSFTLTETRPKVTKGSMVSCSHFRKFFNVFNDKRYEGRRRKLLLGVLAYLLSVGGTIPVTNNLIVVLVLGPPFCFTSDLVGVLRAALGGTLLVTPLCISILSKCLSEFAMMMIAFVSFFAGLVLLAFTGDFSNPELAVFMVPVVVMFRPMIPPILKTILSREVLPNEQGTLFAVLISMDSIGNVIFSLILNNVYSSTVGFMQGFVFLLTAGIVVIAAALVGAMHYFEPTHGYEPIPGECKDTEDSTKNVIND